MKGYPSRYVVFDTESHEHVIPGPTKTKELTLRLGVGLTRDPKTYSNGEPQYWRFRTAEQFHQSILDMPFDSQCIYVFAHNIGFDMRMVEWFRYVSHGDYMLLPPAGMKGAGRYKIPMIILDSPPFILRLWRRDGQQIMLLDTYQWMMKSLRDLGDMISARKGEMPKPEASDREWWDYCERDVEVLHALLRRLWRFLASLRCDDFQPTPASQALHMYRMRFERKRIIRPEDPSVFTLDRQAYYGGYTEAFFIGTKEETIHKVDVNSLYPYVMWDNLYPCEVMQESLDKQQFTPPDSFAYDHMTAEVWLDSEIVPWPVKCHDGTYHVTGKVRTVLCGPELSLANELGVIKYMGRYVTYRMDNLFGGYVNYLWKCRQSAQQRGDKFGDMMAKQMLNSLHGKFGQRVGDWVYQGRQCPPRTYLAGGIIGLSRAHDARFRVLDGHCYEQTPGDEDPRGFVPIAAWTASYGRVAMRGVRAVCPEGSVLYQATDALLLTGDGLAQLQLGGWISDHEIGKFKYEGAYEWVAIHGNNSLDASNTRQRPGLRRNATKICGEVYEQEDWLSVSAGVYKGNVSSVTISTSYRSYSTAYRHRHVGGDGRTSPWRIDNWETPPEVQRTLPLRG